MAFPNPTASEDRPSTKMGRRHEAEVEIHFNTGDRKGPWWYQGPIWVQEAQVRSTGQVANELHDPANLPFLKLLRAGWNDERILEWVFAETKRTNPEWVATKQAIDSARTRIEHLRHLAEHSNDPRVVRVYSLDRAAKAEEKFLGFVDQDPLKEAPQKRYTDTEKGWRHKQLVILLGMALLDVVFLWGMISFASAPATTGVQTEQASQAASSDLVYILIVAGWVASLIVLYMVQARRTLVSTWEVQPLKHLSLDTHSQAVYLQNSQNEPAPEYIARVLGLKTEAVREYALAVAKLPTDAIGTLQEQVDAQRRELDTVQTTGIENAAMRVNLRTLGGHRAAPIIESGTSVWIIVGIVSLLVTVGVVAAILLAGG